MPRYPIDRATNFIVEEESWQVIEYDHTSVPGTIYLSLTENKINSIYDDVENNIADLDKLAKYSLLLPEEKQLFAIDAEIKPVFTIMKNGKLFSAEYNLLPDLDKHVRIIDDKLVAKKSGEATIYIQLKDCPEIKIPMTIEISEETQNFDAYIEGPDSIRLARAATYVLKDINGTKITTVQYSINNSELASIAEEGEDGCVILANDKNKLTTNQDKLELTIIYDEHVYTKLINIVPLW